MEESVFVRRSVLRQTAASSFIATATCRNDNGFVFNCSSAESFNRGVESKVP